MLVCVVDGLPKFAAKQEWVVGPSWVFARKCADGSAWRLPERWLCTPQCVHRYAWFRDSHTPAALQRRAFAVAKSFSSNCVEISYFSICQVYTQLYACGRRIPEDPRLTAMYRTSCCSITLEAGAARLGLIRGRSALWRKSEIPLVPLSGWPICRHVRVLKKYAAFSQTDTRPSPGTIQGPPNAHPRPTTLAGLILWLRNRGTSVGICSTANIVLLDQGYYPLDHQSVVLWVSLYLTAV